MRHVASFVAVAVVCASVSGCHDIQSSTPSAVTPTAVSQTPTALRLVATPATLPAGGGTSTIRVELVAGITGVRNTRVALSASSGTMAGSEVMTDNTGHAIAEWSGAQSGTITAVAGDLTTTAPIVVEVRTTAPPPSSPRPPTPAPTPTPDPVPPSGPAGPTITVSPTTPSVARNVDATFVAEVRGPFAAGETVVAYEWDFDTDAGATTDSMTLNPAASHEYTAIGVYIVTVTARTTTGREIFGTTKMIVTN